MSVEKSEIVDYVRLHASPAYDPKISDADIDTVIEMYRLEDDTFDNDAKIAATADVWDVKAGRTANFHNITVNGRNMSASEAHEHFAKCARDYRRRRDVQVA